MLLTLMNNTDTSPLFGVCVWLWSTRGICPVVATDHRGGARSHGAVRLLLPGIMWAAYQTLKQADASLQLRRARSHVCCSP